MPRKPVQVDPERQLMIKTKTCQRLLREAAFYRTEVIENEANVKAMKDEKKDKYDIKRFEQILEESKMMVPDSQTRLNQAIQDLESFLSEGGGAETGDASTRGMNDAAAALDVNGEWYVAARGILEQYGNEKPSTHLDSTVTATDLGDLKDGEAF